MKQSDQIDQLLIENQNLAYVCGKLQQQAEGHAQEARTQRSTVYGIYQLIGAQKGDWNGAEPVREYINQQAARIADLENRNEKLAEALLRCCTHIDEPCDAPGCEICALLKYCDDVLTANAITPTAEPSGNSGQLLYDDLLSLQALCNYEDTSANIHDAIVRLINAVSKRGTAK